MWTDLRYAARTLGRSPGFTAVAVVSLALGIGANTSIFSLLDQALVRSLPVREPGRMVVLHWEGPRQGRVTSDNHETVWSYPIYRELRDRSQTFDGVIARSGTPVSISYHGDTERAGAEVVSGNFFDVLGVRPAIGRMLTPEDDRKAGAHPLVVLTHSYWERRFGANPALLNETIRVNGQPMTVIGVAAKGFRGVLTGQTPDVFVPIAMKREITPDWNFTEDRRTAWLSVFARLKPGISREQAAAASQVTFQAIMSDDLATMKSPAKRFRDRVQASRLEIRDAAQGVNQLSRSWRTPLLVLMGMVGLVLLIACANVANLSLARAAARQKEVAIRLALGASRWALARQFLIESAMVSLGGGALGLAIAFWTTSGLLGLLPADTAGGFLSADIDLRILGFNLLVSLATGLLFGILPALQGTRPDVAPTLKDQATNVASGGQARFRKIIVAGQVALSLMLMVGAGLFARSLVNLLKYNPGFRVERLLQFEVDPSLAGYQPTRVLAFHRDLQERLTAIAGTRAVGGASMGPLNHNDSSSNVTVEGYTAKEDENMDCQRDDVMPGYFRTLGIPIVAGREFTDSDGADAPKVVVVNETFAKHFFGNGNPVGRRMVFGGGTVTLDREIVGVVKDHQFGSLRGKVKRFVFSPSAQDKYPGHMTFYLRAAGDESSLGPQIRQIVRSMDANLPVFGMKSMQVTVEESILTDRLVATLASAFGLLATLLAAIGLYGVIAFTVARRTAEIGVRMALGAARGNVVWLVMREVALLAVAGIAAGLPAALALSRYVESELFGLKANDPLMFAGAAAALAAVAMFAGYVPAHRAARIDPIHALRHE